MRGEESDMKEMGGFQGLGTHVYLSHVKMERGRYLY